MNTHHSSHSPHTSVGRHPDRFVPAHRLVAAKPAEEPSHQVAGGFSSALRRYPLVLGISALLAVAIATVAALILYNSADPTEGIRPASIVALGLTALGGGIAAGKLTPSAPVVAGAISGGLTGVLILLLSHLWGDGGLLSWCMSGGVFLVHTVGSSMTRPRKKPLIHTTGKHHSHR